MISWSLISIDIIKSAIKKQGILMIQMEAKTTAWQKQTISV
jgi:hypothetical protein